MGKMSWKHIILGGLFSASLLFSLGFLNLVVFAQDWLWGVEDLLGHIHEFTLGGVIAQVVLALVMGVGLIWLYAAIRPRFGPGPRTAAIAGFGIWLITSARDVFWLSWGFGPPRSMIIAILVYLPILVGTAVVVAWAYKEDEGATETTAEGG